MVKPALIGKESKSIQYDRMIADPVGFELATGHPPILGISHAKRNIAIGPEVTIRPPALMEAHERILKS